MIRWQERRLSVAGLSLRVREAGRGHPVLMLHGFTGRAESLADVGAALAARRRAVCVDLVGHGESDAPDDGAHYTMERCVAQLLGALDALALERPHVLGYSMGARVGLALCVAQPERIASATLVGARAGLPDPCQRAERVRADRALAQRILREGLPAFVDHWLSLPLFASQRRLGEAVLARARAERLRSSPVGLARSLQGMGAGAQPPLHAHLGRVALPVCLVVGAEDEPFRRAAEELGLGLPDARVQVVPEAGHAAHLENPDAFLRLTEDFLDAVESGGHPPRPRPDGVTSANPIPAAASPRRTERPRP